MNNNIAIWLLSIWFAASLISLSIIRAEVKDLRSQLEICREDKYSNLDPFTGK